MSLRQSSGQCSNGSPWQAACVAMRARIELAICAISFISIPGSGRSTAGSTDLLFPPDTEPRAAPRITTSYNALSNVMRLYMSTSTHKDTILLLQPRARSSAARSAAFYILLTKCKLQTLQLKLSRITRTYPNLLAAHVP